MAFPGYVLGRRYIISALKIMHFYVTDMSLRLNLSVRGKQKNILFFLHPFSLLNRITS